MHGQQNIKNQCLRVSLAGPLPKVSSGRIRHTYSAYIDKKVIRIQCRNNLLFDDKYQLSIPTEITLFPTVLWTK